MGSRFTAVRGATQLPTDSPEALSGAVRELFDALLAANSLKPTRIIAVLFSQTDDITSANPASQLRKFYPHIPCLFCAQEPQYKDSLPRTLRVLLFYRARRRKPPHPIYLHGAKELRPDIS